MRFLLFLIALTTPYTVHANAIDSLINTLIGEPIPRALTPQPAVTLSSTAPLPNAMEKSAGDTTLKNPAHIIVLDKRTNDLTPITLTTTAPHTIRDITFSVKTCLRHHPKVGQHSMWISIVAAPKKALKNQELAEEKPLPLYEGWMYSAFPEATALDHPRYALRLITCALPQ